MGLFDRQPTVTLYDLTNTYFEGEASEQPHQRGHSKEKRSDCAATLGLMLDERLRASLQGLRRQRRARSRRQAPSWSWTAASPRPACSGCVSTTTAIWSSAANRTVFDGGRRIAPNPVQPDRAPATAASVSTDGGTRCACTPRGREGTRHRRAFRHPLRDRPDPAPRGAGAPPHPQTARPGVAAHRAIEDEAFPRRRPLPDRGHRRETGKGGRRHLDPPSPGRLDGHPSGGPCAAARPTGTKTPTHLHHPHRRGARSRPNSACAPSTARRADGHLFITVIAYHVQVIPPDCAGTATPPVGPRCAASWTAAARHRHLPAPRRTHAARANGHATRTRAAGHLRRARRRPARGRPQNAHLTDPSHRFVRCP